MKTAGSRNNCRTVRVAFSSVGCIGRMSVPRVGCSRHSRCASDHRTVFCQFALRFYSLLIFSEMGTLRHSASTVQKPVLQSARRSHRPWARQSPLVRMHTPHPVLCGVAPLLATGEMWPHATHGPPVSGVRPVRRYWTRLKTRCGAASPRISSRPRVCSRDIQNPNTRTTTGYGRSPSGVLWCPSCSLVDNLPIYAGSEPSSWLALGPPAICAPRLGN